LRPSATTSINELSFDNSMHSLPQSNSHLGNPVGYRFDNKYLIL